MTPPYRFVCRIVPVIDLIMRKIVLMAAVIATMTVGAKAQNSSWRKTEEPWVRKNSIAMSLSAMGFFGNEARSFGAIGLEYDRAVYRNLSVGATGLYAPFCTPGDTAGSYIKTGTFWFAGAKLNYNLPVVRNWLYFRIGAGAGLGVQHIHGAIATADEQAPPSPDTRISPHLVVDAHWVLRVSRSVDLRFAPFVISTSQYIFGSRLHRSGGKPFEHADFFTFGAAMRF